MPQIPSTPYPFITLLQVFSFIQHPNDAVARDSFDHALGGLALAQSFAKEHIEATALTRDQKKIIANAPGPAVFFQAIDDAADSYSRDIGEIFLTVLAAAERTPALASVNKAIALQIRRRARRNKPVVTPEHLMRKWGDQKSISHFLAALQLVGTHDLEEIYGVRKNGSAVSIDAASFSHHIEQTRFDDEALARRVVNWIVDFACLAEELRIRASQVYAQGQKAINRPLLNAEEAWFFGPDLGLPRVEFSMIRLPRDEVDYLLT